MTSTSPQSAVLIELEPVVAQNLDRHLSLANAWHPHDYIPWSEGRNFAFLGGEDWTPEQSRLDETAKAAMIVNLLTEDNLPSYHREIATRFGRDGAWRRRSASGQPKRGVTASRYATIWSSPEASIPWRSSVVAWCTWRPATTRATSRCWRRWPTCPSRNWRRGSATATRGGPPDVLSPNNSSPG